MAWCTVKGLEPLLRLLPAGRRTCVGCLLVGNAVPGVDPSPGASGLVSDQRPAYQARERAGELLAPVLLSSGATAGGGGHATVTVYAAADAHLSMGLDVYSYSFHVLDTCGVFVATNLLRHIYREYSRWKKTKNSRPDKTNGTKTSASEKRNVNGTSSVRLQLHGSTPNNRTTRLDISASAMEKLNTPHGHSQSRPGFSVGIVGGTARRV